MASSLRDQIVANAREWLGTPYHHNQCSKYGIDCVQFTKVVAESVGIPQVVHPNYYNIPRNDYLLEIFNKHSNFKRVATILPGDILVFRIAGLPHHVGIATSKNTFIHTDYRQGVVEINLGNWVDRCVAVYEVVL